FKKMQEIIDANNIQGDYLELTEGNAEKLDEAFREWSDEDLALNDVATKPEVEPTQTKSGQEVSEAPKPKRKAKGKWRTVGSSPSRAELQKLIREFYVNDKMVIEDDGTIRNGKTGKTAGYVVRVANNGRWQFGYYETAEQAESKQEPAEQKETEKFFEQFEATDKQGNKIFVAKIKHGQFPEPEVFDKSVELIDKLDEMAKAHGVRYGGFYHERGDGHEYHCKTTEARDKFVLSIMNDGFLEAELNRQQKTIQDGIKTKQAEIEKIINDAKEDAYKILEADKYPEIKNFINREIGNQADTIIETGDIKKAREFADRLVKNVKSYKDEGKLANGVLVEILNKWETEKRGANRRLSGKLSDKYHKATDIVNEYIEKYKKGEVSLEDAREDLKHFLKTGRRKTKTKFSKQGTVDTRIDNFVDDKDLTPQQKLLKSFGEKLGTKVIFFRNKDGRFHGVRKNGATYLNVNSNMPLGKVFWHESMHWLKNNNPKLYQQLVKAAGITDEQRQAYLERTERTDLETDEAIDEEIIADQFEDVAKRNGLLQSIAGKNRGLIERVVQWLKDTMNKFIDHFRNPQGKLTTEQATRLADEFGRIAKDLVDPNGQKIFRYNRRTHNIELADGRGLNETLKSIGSKNYSLAGAQDSVAKLDDEYLKNVDDFFHAKTDEQRRSTFRKLQDMVQRAAEEAGFHNAVPEQTVAYKVRTTAAPKKTVKVYKVFTVADDGSPTALFVGGTEKLPQGVWLDAQDAWHFKAKNGKYYVPSTQNPFTKGGKTGTSVEIPDEATRQELIKRGFLPKGSKATKITALAYRPGWHAGTLPFFPQGGVKPKKGTTSAYPNIHRYNQVVFECELAAEKNFTAEAEAQPKARTKDGKLNTREADLQYMPKDGFYYYATNPLTHGNPELGMWAISGSLKINRALTQEECDKILAEHNMAPQEWEQGKLNLADLGYTGEQNDAARKTLAPITYDDNGEVIPLSQRFDASKDDIRYSIGRSDNSSESLSQKIQNKFAAWWNGDAKKNRNKEITDLLYRTTGYKVDFGNVKDAD
ncbi:MAG: hypothetical protein IKG61_00905, partial [Selenomonadaceae bacterium]|nr:hypothetical protein [Selenomonadaceae bacterium]